jgi:nucleotide-binding universal stress UspA family protein
VVGAWTRERTPSRPIPWFARIQWDTWSPPGWFDDAEFDETARSFGNPDWVVAVEQDGDVIVVASKGMSGPGRFLLGSVAAKVAHHAPCSVLIARTT